MMQVETLATKEQVATAARSRLYRLLADGLAYPDHTLFACLESGRYRDDVEEACRALAYGVAVDLDGLVASGPYIDFQAHYLRLFEVGLGVPPCPLYSGLYRGGRKAVMEELTRFYNFFGLSVELGAGELPDHLMTELEFMHFLTFKELVALNGGDDAGAYRRAEADFLERQLVSWLPALEARLAPLDPSPFYVALVRLTTALTQADFAALHHAEGIRL